MQKLSDLTPEQRLDLGEKVRAMPEEDRVRFINSLSKEQQLEYLYDPIIHLRRKQYVPVDLEKNETLILAGRGFGKTFAIARLYKKFVEEDGVKHLTLAAPASADLTNTLIFGESGIMAAYGDHEENKPEYSSRYGVLRHKNGAVTRLVSSEASERSRGINSEVLLCDEVAAWSGNALEFYHNLLYGLRLGISQCVLVTTPKATELMIDLVERSKDPDSNLKVVSGSTLENSANLSPQMIANAKRTMHTRLGLQEVEGQLILTNDRACWNPELIEKCEVSTTGEFHPSNWKKFCIGVDPAGDTTSKSSDETGIIVGILTEADKILIVEDKTAHLTGQQSVEIIASLYTKYSAFCPGKIRVEKNGTGNFFKAMFKKDYPFIPIEDFASINKKYARAVSTAHKYETEIVYHDKNADLVALGQEMISWDGGGRSPNHLDGLNFCIEGLINSGFVRRKPFIL